MLEQKFTQGLRIVTLSHHSSTALFPQVKSPMSVKIYWYNNETSTEKALVVFVPLLLELSVSCMFLLHMKNSSLVLMSCFMLLICCNPWCHTYLGGAIWSGHSSRRLSIWAHCHTWSTLLAHKPKTGCLQQVKSKDVCQTNLYEVAGWIIIGSDLPQAPQYNAMTIFCL